MLKKIFLTLCFLFLGSQLQLRYAFAYSGGLLDGKTIYIGNNINSIVGTTNLVTDNDESTGIQLDTSTGNTKTLWYKFDNAKSVIAYQFKSDSTMVMRFYDQSGRGLYAISASGDGSKRNITQVDNVYYVSITNTSISKRNVYEFDVFAIQDTTPPSNVTNLKTSVSTTKIDLTFTQPEDADFKNTKIYLNGVLKATLDKTTKYYSLTGLLPDTNYDIKISTVDNNNNESNGVTTTVRTLPLPNVINLSLVPSTNSLLAQWINPTDSGFIGNDLYLDGNFITSLDKDATSYNFTNLNPNTSYAVKVVSKFIDGYSSTGQTATAKTTIPVEDVADLQADAKYDRVKLSWTRPNSEFFSHVKIYRKNVERKSFWDQLFGTTSVSAENTSDGYTPMFETNGTYWIDLTVTPDTTYSYKVTSVNIEGDESQGVTVETTTPSEPVPVLAGVATTQNENGDYVVTWTSPSKGTVKLLIEGREYAQVDAATKQIVVRKEDMKTDFFGAYAATLIPIGEYGTKGQAVNVPSLGGKIDFPLSFQDFMETTISILAWVAPFILLSLVFIFWRPIFNFIKKAISERRVKQ
ncbi:hypothetical protein KN10_2791 [Anoxybacillus flavithermus NBRC 109594]|uniref:Fibronectin type-III domain-containing protein n=1 Tax=Anoxybacillus flavithermus NBRC 109594 TaxID=1315967 RepID=R4FHB5_9BACL|nr:hypothetical protein [Anoxybacillus flavithermus]GAC92355.1 hypothetical protein KN10_2791 [Anoxybacillus flavithermus NBRC 109594]